MPRSRLLIFLRRPVLGQVKTRLAATIGAGPALAVYRALLDHTRRVTTTLPIDKWLYYADGAPAQPDEWPAHYHKASQVPGDLGARMRAAFAEAFAAGCDQVVIIGTDCPGLSAPLLLDALAHLTDHDVVLGPAADGGYYLLGITQLQPSLFESIPWSTDQVLARTVAVSRQAGLRIALLPELSDVDIADDLRRFPHLPGG